MVANEKKKIENKLTADVYKYTQWPKKTAHQTNRNNFVNS